MVSIITPLHKAGNDYIKETYNSLLTQTDQDFEWIIVENNGGKVPEHFKADTRIKVFRSDKAGQIGALKKEACSYATGNIIIELDADDQLTETAVADIKAAFTEGVVFVYSDDIEYNKDMTTQLYDAYWGWQKASTVYQGKVVEYNTAFDLSPASLRQIFWAPNHVRAWRKDAYDKIGGHNEQLTVGDDHELVMRFYVAYGSAGFHYIPKPLYLYRLHDGNTFKAKADAIAQQSWNNYNVYREAIAMRWAKDKNLKCLDLGGRLNSVPGYETVDLFDADHIADLNEPWPWNDSSVGVVRASHVIEHLKDPIHTMNEAYRVLAPGGWLFVEVPSTDGRGAFQDPTHVSFWNENSFNYYIDKNYSRYAPKYIGKFQKSRVVTYFPSKKWEQMNISVVQADLICLKPPYSNRPVGEVLIWADQDQV